MKEMRGLQTFIADIRACKSMEAETKRINKELANIRGKFGQKKVLSGYDQKKYVSKLVFIFLLGNEIEFGYAEAVALLSAPKFSEKQIGYLFVSVLMTDSHELIAEVAKAINHDLRSVKELEVCLALNCIANVGGKNMGASVVKMVQKLIVAKEAPPFVKKKATLAMLRLLREGQVELQDLSGFATSVIQLLADPDMGVTTAAASLVIAMALRHADEFKGCVSVAINRLHRLLAKGCDDMEYVYTRTGIAAPWICVKLLRLLQIYPAPDADSPTCNRLNECMDLIFTKAPTLAVKGKPKPNAKTSNANHSIFFELCNLIVHYDNDAERQAKASVLLGRFLNDEHPNLRFLALEGLAAMTETSHSHDAVRTHLDAVLTSLKTEKDPTVQRRAVDVLYGVCDSETVEKIVKDLLLFLKKSDYSVREEVVLKIAILAERNAPNSQWYVNVILTLITMAGDHVIEEVWHRVLQIIVNRQDVQDHAAAMCFRALLDPSCHENMVKVGAYVLGEFGHLIANDPSCVPEKQLELLQTHYPMVSVETRCLLLSTYAKFANLFPEMREPILAVLSNETLTKNANSEIQQRANEYGSLLRADQKVVATVLDEMPPFQEKESSILSKLEKSKDAITDAVGSRAKRPHGEKPVVATPDSVGGGGPAVAAASGPLTASSVNNDQFFTKFWTQDNGVLYENPVLQIGCKCEFAGSRAKVNLFYGNLSPNVVFTDIETRVYNPKGDESEVKLHAGAVATVLKPGVQETQLIQCDVVQMKLPILPNKFFTALPNPLDAATFGAKWKQIGGPPREAIVTKNTSAPRSTADLVARMQAFKLPVTNGIDPNSQNCVATAVMTTSGDGVVGILARVEPTGQSVKVTVRAANEKASPIVANCLASVLCA